MAATITTKETFPSSVPKKSMDEEVRLRMASGAIRSTYELIGDEWVLSTEWNVIGEQ